VLLVLLAAADVEWRLLPAPLLLRLLRWCAAAAAAVASAAAVAAAASARCASTVAIRACPDSDGLCVSISLLGTVVVYIRRR
jgi:hypothetical protein